jgi:soluble lytic murein transglycosylase-like protein
VNLALVGIPLALFGAIMLIAKPAHAPGTGKRLELPLHIASPVVTKQLVGSYPETVKKLSSKWSKVFKIPTSWLRSQAYAESKNTFTSRNPRSGATGVLQLLPVTADWLVTSLLRTTLGRNPLVAMTFKEGWTDNLVENLCNPDINIMLAAYYLAILKKKFGDNHETVAAAYHAGPPTIAALLEKGEPFPKSTIQYIAMVNDAKRLGFM